jgi:hypothetical protein
MTAVTNKLLTLIIFLIITTNINAKSKCISANSFEELQKIFNGLDKKTLSKTLLVMDDDDTLTMMSCPNQDDAATCQYLGGPAWFSWQDDLINKNSPFKVTDNFPQLIKISALLFAMNDMALTDDAIPATLQKLVDSEGKLLVLTARGKETISATESQLSHLSLDKNNLNSPTILEFISKNALTGKKSKISSIASPIKSDKCFGELKNPISYQQGVMYVAGQDKGKMLKCLLKLTKPRQVKNIYFIDDTMDNVIDVNNAFSDDRRYNVTAIHYTALSAHKAALTKGKRASTYQSNAKQRWEAIKATLNQELQDPAAID